MVKTASHTVHSPPARDGNSPDDYIDLTRFVVPEPPASDRGRRSVWVDRFSQMIEQCPGQWIDATAAWGVKTSPKHVLLQAEKVGAHVDARTHNSHLFLRIH